MMTSVQQITEVVVKMPRAITLPVASNVPVNVDSPEMDSRAAVCHVILTYRSANKNLLAVPFSRTILADRTFSCAAATVWNALPSSVTSVNTFPTFNFKQRL